MEKGKRVSEPVRKALFPAPRILFGSRSETPRSRLAGSMSDLSTLKMSYRHRFARMNLLGRD
jgi:hypothetical protein